MHTSTRQSRQRMFNKKLWRFIKLCSQWRFCLSFPAVVSCTIFLYRPALSFRYALIYPSLRFPPSLLAPLHSILPTKSKFPLPSPRAAQIYLPEEQHIREIRSPKRARRQLYQSQITASPQRESFTKNCSRHNFAAFASATADYGLGTTNKPEKRNRGSSILTFPGRRQTH